MILHVTTWLHVVVHHSKQTVMWNFLSITAAKGCINTYIVYFIMGFIKVFIISSFNHVKITVYDMISAI